MWRQIELETLIEHIGNVKHYLGEWKTELDKEKEKTYANAMASQPAKMNNSENHIASIPMSTKLREF